MNAGADRNPETRTSYKRRSHATVIKMSTTKIRHTDLPHSMQTVHEHRSREMNQHRSIPTTATTKIPTL